MENINESRIMIEECMKELKRKELVFNKDLEEKIKESSFFKQVKKQYNNQNLQKVTKQKIKRVQNIILAEAKKGKKEVIIYPDIIKANNYPEKLLKENVTKWLIKEGFKTKSSGGLIVIKGW